MQTNIGNVDSDDNEAKANVVFLRKAACEPNNTRLKARSWEDTEYGDSNIDGKKRRKDRRRNFTRF
jgi:hypothetical protein